MKAIVGLFFFQTFYIPLVLFKILSLFAHVYFWWFFITFSLFYGLMQLLQCIENIHHYYFGVCCSFLFVQSGESLNNLVWFNLFHDICKTIYWHNQKQILTLALIDSCESIWYFERSDSKNNKLLHLLFYQL